MQLLDSLVRHVTPRGAIGSALVLLAPATAAWQSAARGPVPPSSLEEPTAPSIPGVPLLTSHALFDRPCQSQKALTSDGQSGDNFGNSVSIESDTSVLATWLDDDRGTDAGAAYVFERQGSEWVETAKLLASDGSAGDWLGTAVDLSGSATVVCAVNHDHNGSNSGAAYVYEKLAEGWVETSELLASDGAPEDWFGFFGGISGNTAVVTANRDDDQGNNSGSAYVFRKQLSGQWVETAKLLPSDGAAGDQFGYSVAIDGTTIVLSSPFDDDLGSGSGSIYIFERDGGQWVETAKLRAADGAPGDNLGTSVDVEGGVVLAGARNADARGVDSGAAYLYERVEGVWRQTAKLVAFDGAAGDAYGDASISGDRAVCGASLHDSGGTNAGAAYLYQRVGARWFPTGKLVACDSQAGDNFAFQVGIWNDRVLIGAPEEDGRGAGSGAAYYYDLDPRGLGWVLAELLR